MAVHATGPTSSQSALNVVAEIKPEQSESLASLLAGMKGDPGHNPVLPFARIDTIHFARLVILPAAPRKGGGVFPPTLVITTNFDGDMDAHLRELAAVGGAGLVRILSHCAGFPASPDRDDVLRYLRAHHRRPEAFYVNTIGREVRQVDFEARLHRALQQRLDQGDWRGLSPQAVRQALIDFVAGSDELREALVPRPSRTLVQKLAGFVLVGATALVLLALAVALLPLTILFVLVLRLHEIGNRADHHRPRDDRIERLEADEDFGAQNQFSAVGEVQAGWFRLALVSVALRLLQLAATHVFNDGRLADIVTIHFARWVLIDERKRLYFMSNYDGSADSYQDDFIERVAFGLNLVFSNGKGWPRTKYLVFKGASDEQSFKAYYRDHQVETQVWYRAAAYDGLTAVNVGRNAKIRAGLSGTMNADQAQAWLRLL